ncbi:hypothetical protein H6F42_17705 [Pseudanabaena sp. FACHB-1998]|uniref:hypothetical protein n=1 Tax=Pseudanabaena sp. FACHB-1998 TaxID=2692858 RepID=UPI0016804261|nr:hypothetical protein [Pseudanabaena sp. FACHB-1998]MBD2178758.1 hypothetical protein [Pseudanabaena sp. FACHB-1998]
MSLLTSSIDLDTITPPAISNSQFPSHQVENLASLFLKAGDTVSPIIVRKISPIAFEVLEGHFEYYAAIKAQEIDEQFTAIRAYVVPPELESTILEQYKFLRSPSASTPIPAPPELNHETSPDLAKIEEAIANRLEQKLTAAIEKTIEERISVSLQLIVGQVTKQLDAHLNDFRQSLSLVPVHQVIDTKPETIQAVAELEPEKISKTDKATKSKATAKTTSKTPTKPKSESKKTAAKNKNIDDNSQISQVLSDFNTLNIADLENKLKQSAKGNIKFARPIHEQRSQQLFISIDDVISRVKGLAEKTMERIVSSW